MMDADKLRASLIKHEGRKRYPYLDTARKITIGIGHNLSDRGLSDQIIEAIFAEDLGSVIADLNHRIPWWTTQDEVRQRVLAELCFNMGIERLCLFVRMLEAMRGKDYSAAARELLESRWREQVHPTRAGTLAYQLMNGQDPPEAA